MNHVSTFILIDMSIERLCSIIKPFTFKEYLITKRPHITVFVAQFVSAVYLFPFAVCLRGKPFINTDNMRDYYVNTYSKMRGLSNVRIMWTTFCYIASPVLILTLNITISIALYRIVNTKKPVSHNGDSRGQ